MNGLLEAQTLVAIDTCIWIYHLADHPVFGPACGEILTGINNGDCPALVSELTLMELLVRPLQLGLVDVADEYETLLIHFPHVKLTSVSREIFVKAASMRANYGLKAPDAIIIASALVHGASRIITNDAKWKRLKEIDVMILSDFVPNTASQ